MNDNINVLPAKDIQSGILVPLSGDHIKSIGLNSVGTPGGSPPVSNQVEGQATQDGQPKEEGNECNPPWENSETIRIAREHIDSLERLASQ